MIDQAPVRIVELWHGAHFDQAIDPVQKERGGSFRWISGLDGQ